MNDGSLPSFFLIHSNFKSRSCDSRKELSLIESVSLRRGETMNVILFDVLVLCLSILICQISKGLQHESYILSVLFMPPNLSITVATFKIFINVIIIIYISIFECHDVR